MMQKPIVSTKAMIRVAMAAAITAALSQVAIPLPFGVPVTLQTLAIALCGYALGWQPALMSTGLYILIGAAGLPVFANFSGGPGALVGMTGGFIWGFLPFATLCGMGMAVKNKVAGIALGTAGLIACHLMGAAQFSIVTATPFPRSLMLVSLPFLAKDVASVIVAYFAAMAIRKALVKARLMEPVF